VVGGLGVEGLDMIVKYQKIYGKIQKMGNEI
jgi:hypothetical protein